LEFTLTATQVAGTYSGTITHSVTKSVRRNPASFLLMLGLVLAVGVSPAASSVASADDAGSVGLRLLEAPTSRRDDPRARVYVVDHLHPGESISWAAPTRRQV
jgi:hypothetical protein